MYEDYSFVLDIDGTLCPIKGKGERYEDIVPYKDMVQKVRWYKERGAKIVLFTSRNMNSYNGNIGLINKHTAAILTAWLAKWNIPYDEIVYGKVWPGHKGFYVDDRTVRPDEFLSRTTEELDAICNASRPCNGGCSARNTDIVITMAGAGSRFRNAGWNVPKYMIKARGKTLFEWAMESLSEFKSAAASWIFVALKDDAADVVLFIKEKCAVMGIDNPRVIAIDRITSGQAETAMLASKGAKDSRSVLIYNIDTYVEKGYMKPLAEDSIGGEELDGYIPCFKAAGEHWSFVRLDDSGRATEIKEKERISDNCTIGAYWFRSWELYKHLYHTLYGGGESLVNGERYIAPMYDALLSEGGNVRIANVDAKRVHVLGTPEELKAFIGE